jgi:(S)-ureidoglycine aminohydrolase
MDLFGHTRSRVAANHALITPDTRVWGPIPGWRNATGSVHISPAIGARFVQQTVVLEEGGFSGGAADGVERVIFVPSGAVDVKLPGGGPVQKLGAEGFAYFPPDRPHEIRATEPTTLVVFEKRFSPAANVERPQALVGNASDVTAEPFMGDEAARLQTLLPNDERFDMAVNLFTYQPGATLPQVEIHVMEHGLMMLDGMGVYRLGDAWYPVRAGDVIWMASYCPQWFVAMGKRPARYLYYKDVNRDALA